MTRVSILIFFSFLTLASLARRADAQDVEQARALFEQGLQLAQDERWSEAAAAFRQAQAIAPRPSIAFNLASVLYRLGSLVDADAALVQYLADATSDDKNYSEALRLRGMVAHDVAGLSLRVGPQNAEVVINGVRREGAGAVRQVTLDPGDHRIEVRADGFEPQALSLSLGAGEQRSATVELLSRKPQPTLEVGTLSAASIARQRVATDLTASEHPPERDEGGSIFSSPWFWIATAAVVGGGITAGVLAWNYRAIYTHDADGGTTDIVIRAPSTR